MRRLLTAAAAVSLVTAIGAQPPLFQADSHLTCSSSSSSRRRAALIAAHRYN
jgi:hypothetical protein